MNDTPKLPKEKCNKIEEETITVAVSCELFVVPVCRTTKVKDVVVQLKHQMEIKKIKISKKKNYLHYNASPLQCESEPIYPLYLRKGTFSYGPKIKIRKSRRDEFSKSVGSPRDGKRANSLSLGLRVRKLSGSSSLKKERASVNLSQMPVLKFQLDEGKHINKITTPRAVNDISVDIIEEIGSGSCSKVYSCYIQDWMCAVKIIPLDKTNENTYSEILLLQKLPSHPNIIKYFFYVKDTQNIKIFTKLYPTTLHNLMQSRKNRYFSIKKIYKILLDISKGILFLHERNIIHRDIKPQNIFIQKQNNENTYVIGDFDSAKQLSDKIQPTSTIGTPCYMAPEVLLSNDEKPYTLQADIFSFGMLIFHIITLNIPYYNIKSFEVSNNIINGVPPEFPKDLPKNYKTICELFEECTLFYPEARPTATQIFSKLFMLTTTSMRSRTVISHSSPASEFNK